jgi:hypothetical protein
MGDVFAAGSVMNRLFGQLFDFLNTTILGLSPSDRAPLWLGRADLLIALFRPSFDERLVQIKKLI